MRATRSSTRPTERGHETARAAAWDALVLDLMLPGIDGLEICRRARSMERYTPIIITSARGSEVHRVLGLEIGADDYLAKPFSVLELVARVRALLRRVDALARAPAAGRCRSRTATRNLRARARGEARRRARGPHAARVRPAVFSCQQSRQGVLAQLSYSTASGDTGTTATSTLSTRTSIVSARKSRSTPRTRAASLPCGAAVTNYPLRTMHRDPTHAVTRLSLVFCVLLLASSSTAAWLTIRANRMLEQELVQRLSSDVAEHIAASAEFMDATGLRPDAVRILFDQLMSVNPSVEVYFSTERARSSATQRLPATFAANESPSSRSSDCFAGSRCLFSATIRAAPGPQGLRRREARARRPPVGVRLRHSDGRDARRACGRRRGETTCSRTPSARWQWSHCSRCSPASSHSGKSLGRCAV